MEIKRGREKKKKDWGAGGKRENAGRKMSEI